MSKWDKLLARICALSKDLRFEELRKVLESYEQAQRDSSRYTAIRIEIAFFIFISPFIFILV